MGFPLSGGMGVDNHQVESKESRSEVEESMYFLLMEFPGGEDKSIEDTRHPLQRSCVFK